MSETPAGATQPTNYTYGYDVHGSVSLLIGETGSAAASYGYRPYGDSDKELTAGDFDPAEPDIVPTIGAKDDPANAYRYTGKRFDSGSGSLDMGARRFGPDVGRFLQRDLYNGALSDLALSMDPLTQNRYSLAGGNPISFVETDGHAATMLVDGGGGGSTTPNPTSGGSDPNREENPIEVVGGFFKGFAEAGVETLTGLAQLGQLAGAAQGYMGPDAQLAAWQGIAETGLAIAQDPKGAVEATVHAIADPITEDWNAGRPGEAIGRGVFEGLSLVVGTKGVGAALKGARGASAVATGVRAASAADEVAAGARLFRVWGGKSTAWGRSWTRVDPRTVSNYRNAAGLPPGNAGTKLSVGTVIDPAGTRVTTAQRIGDNLGGLDEVVVPWPKIQLKIEDIFEIDPPF
jgi:RHS repeat-associated protein